MTELQQRVIDPKVTVSVRGERRDASEFDSPEQRKAEQAKKDAGDERLLCAVLFEEGEPN